MIVPRKVKFEAKKRENENIEFRTFLKCNADEKELDEQFKKLHEELFANYDCSRCRNCCKMYCKLGEYKPENCRKYPYTNQPGRLQSLYSVLEAVEVCPIAFEIYERLKKEYGFGYRE